MTSPLSDPDNVMVVWDDDDLAAALDPDDEAGTKQADTAE